MNDFDGWFKSIDIRHFTLRDVAFMAYGRGRVDEQAETPKGLPGVTTEQVYARLPGYIGTENRESWAEDLTCWFNDPNRDAPVNPTMHPDLEWLASLPPERFVVPKLSQGDGTLYFFKQLRPHASAGWVKVATIDWGTGTGPRRPESWTLAEIEHARKHLAKRKVNDLVHDLINLPDYETWFEEHGDERTVWLQRSMHAEATVHELYTHFRARLLDELRQAGVIGTKGDKS